MGHWTLIVPHNTHHLWNSPHFLHPCQPVVVLQEVLQGCGTFCLVWPPSCWHVDAYYGCPGRRSVGASLVGPGDLVAASPASKVWQGFGGGGPWV